MNASPNTPAMIVRNTFDLPCMSALIGTPVMPTSLAALDVCGYGPVWNFAGRPLRCPICGQRVSALLDADLQQLRPPAQSTETVREIINEVTA